MLVYSELSTGTCLEETLCYICIFCYVE